MMCNHPGCDVDHDADVNVAVAAEATEAAEHEAEAAEARAEAVAAEEAGYTERAEDMNDTAEAIAQIDADARVEQTRLETEAAVEIAQAEADAAVDTAVVLVTEEEPTVETEPETQTEAVDEGAPAEEAQAVTVPPQVEDEAGEKTDEDKGEKPKPSGARRHAFGARRGRR